MEKVDPFEKIDNANVLCQKINQNENKLENNNYLKKNEPKKMYESIKITIEADQNVNNGSCNFFKNHLKLKSECPSHPRVTQSNMQLYNSLRTLKKNSIQPIYPYKETRESPVLKDFFISKNYLNYQLREDPIKNCQKIKQKLQSPSLTIFLSFPQQSYQRFYR